MQHTHWEHNLDAFRTAPGRSSDASRTLLGRLPDGSQSPFGRLPDAPGPPSRTPLGPLPDAFRTAPGRFAGLSRTYLGQPRTDSVALGATRLATTRATSNRRLPWAWAAAMRQKQVAATHQVRGDSGNSKQTAYADNNQQPTRQLQQTTTDAINDGHALDDRCHGELRSTTATSKRLRAMGKGCSHTAEAGCSQASCPQRQR